MRHWSSSQGNRRQTAQVSLIAELSRTCVDEGAESVILMSYTRRAGILCMNMVGECRSFVFFTSQLLGEHREARALTPVDPLTLFPLLSQALLSTARRLSTSAWTSSAAKVAREEDTLATVRLQRFFFGSAPTDDTASPQPPPLSSFPPALLPSRVASRPSPASKSRSLELEEFTTEPDSLLPFHSVPLPFGSERASS